MNKHRQRNWLSGLTLALAATIGAPGFAAGEQTGNATAPLLNAGFEPGAADWSLQDPAAMSQVSPEAARSGKMGLRVTDNDDKRGSSAFSPAVPVQAGQGFRFCFWARTTTASASASLWFLDAGGKTIPEYQPTAVLKSGNDWTQYQLLARAPVGAQSLKIWIHSFSTPKTTVDFDDFSLESVSGPEVTGLSVPVPASAPLEARTRKAPPYIVLKLDDLVSTGNGGVQPRWQKLADFIKQRQVKAGLGLITSSLEGDKPAYFNWLKEQQATGLFEFWDHGYTHKEWEENGKKLWEFSGPSYAEQKDHFVRSQTLAREKLGLSLAAFGAGFGQTDDNTVKALAGIPELKIWLYGDSLSTGGKTILHRTGVNIENPTFVPNLERFIKDFNLYPQDRYFVIQGHPAMWDDARFDQFAQIIDFLTAQNAVFITPSEFVALPATQTPTATVPKLQPVNFQAAPGTPAAPQSLIANGDFTALLQNGWTVGGKMAAAPQIVDAQIEGAPSTRALQVELAAAPGGQPWDARLVAARTPVAIAKNDLLVVQFWARSTPKTRIIVVYQQAGEPYEKSIRQTATLRPQWQKYTFYAPAKSAYSAGGSNFELQLGQATGKVELAGVSVQNLGPLSMAEAKARLGPETFEYYGGEEPDDSWIPAAKARIEEHRKADLQIKVVDQNGRPVPDAQVVLKQTKSQFRWGTAVDPVVLEQTPDGEQYRATLKRLFNTATVTNHLKWKATDGNPANRKSGMDTLDWLNANGFAVRGHTLVWGSERYLPDRLKKLSPEETRAAVEQRLTDAVALTKGKVYVWDVVNEAGVNTQLWEKIGWDAFPDAYRRVRLADPDLLLAYNDYNIANEAPDNGALRRKVEARIQYLLDAGAPLDILGDQAHMGIPLTTIPRVLQIWDEWGRKYKKPIEITEFDANVADDAVHEKYVRDFMTAAFSNPNIESFVLWGFWGKTHFLGETGALFRSDWSPRPAALVFEDLVLRQWRTNATLQADNTGTVRTRGFLGDYEVQVRAGGKTTTATLSLDKAGARKTLTLP